MKRYEEMQIDREHSKYPQGLKHYSKHELFENTLFDIELIAYKLRGLWKGNEDGKRDNTGSQEESKSSTKEILRRFMLGLLYGDWDTEDTGQEYGTIADRYIALGEGEQEEHSEGDPRGIEEEGHD